jgi:hypothetical protein
MEALECFCRSTPVTRGVDTDHVLCLELHHLELQAATLLAGMYRLMAAPHATAQIVLQ